jgi:energy-coupling factor transport system substrate-specific component
MKVGRFLSSTLLLMGSLLGLHAFAWPLYLPDSTFFLFQPDAARAFSLGIAFLAIGIIALDISADVLDSKSVALLGVLSALIAALRLVGAGAIGVEPMWFLLIIASYVFGARFGFSLGVISLAVSALLTGGIGPWLPFQMLAAGWIGLFAGFIGSITQASSHKVQRLTLILVGIISSLTFGALMDLQLWPWIAGTDLQLSYVPGSQVVENLQKFLAFHFATALAWDIPRAITTSILLALTSIPIVKSLQRAQIKLNFTSHAMEQKANAQ